MGTMFARLSSYVRCPTLALLFAFTVILGGCSVDESKTKPSATLLQRFGDEMPVKDPTKFAVVISGDSNLRYQGNTSTIYQVLLENGFCRTDIYILDGDGCKKPWYPVDGEASNVNIQALIRHLRDRVRPEDRLFVYTTDHGGQKTVTDTNGKQNTVLSTLQCSTGEEIDANEFASYFSDFRTKHAVFMFDQCYGGGFAEKIAGNGRFIAIAASRADEVSKSDSFPSAFFSAFRKGSSDRNRDGSVSVEEAFLAALRHDKYFRSGEQHPMIIRHGAVISPDTYETFLKNESIYRQQMSDETPL